LCESKSAAEQFGSTVDPDRRGGSLVFDLPLDLPLDLPKRNPCHMDIPLDLPPDLVRGSIL
jgi:hypothetical protein